MKLIVAAIFMIAFPLISSACYYDLTSYVNSCGPSWTNNLGKAVLVRCEYYGHTSERITCIPYGSGYPYNESEHICLAASFVNIDAFKVCPGGPIPPKTLPKKTPDNTAVSCGSVVRTDNQVLSESISILDAPFTLTYSSDRVLGRKDWYRTSIPITSQNFTGHSSIVSEELSINIAGQTISHSFSPLPNLQYNFKWDGKDDLGNVVKGSFPANIQVSETYNFHTPTLSVNDDNILVLSPATYALPLGNPVTSTSTILGTIFDEHSTINGWDISIRHNYDTVRQVLYLGDGSHFNASKMLRQDDTYWVLSPNRSEIYIFNSFHKHIETRNALTNNLIFKFNYLSSSLSSVEDAYGNATTFQYTGQNLSSITSPHGHITQISVGTDGFVSQVTNPESETYKMTYTPDGLLLTFEKPSGNKSTMSYDQDGLLLSDSNEAGNSIVLNRTDTANGFIITETSSLGRIRTHTINVNENTYNRFEEKSNQHYRHYSLDFNAKNNSTMGAGEATISSYSSNDPRFLGQTMQNYFSISDGGSKSLFYNEVSNLSDPSDPFSFTSLTKTWTSNGKTTSLNYNKSTKIILETSPLGKSISYNLNSNGDIQTFQLANFLPVDISYSSTGKIEVIQQGSRTTTFTNDASTGFLSSIENALGQRTDFAYDLMGRVMSQTLSDSRIITYSYDQNGNLASVTPPGKFSHELTHNQSDLLESYIPPSIQNPGNGATYYYYNDDRELTQINRPSGQVVSYSYATNGNLSSISLPSGSRTFGYSSGLMNSSMSEDFFSRYFTYNGSRVSYDSVSQGPFSYYTNNSFNSELLISSENLNINSVNFPVAYSYDNDNLLITSGDASYLRSTLTGAIEEIAISNSKTSYTYSVNFGELSSVKAIYNSSIILYESDFLRDGTGRISGITESYAGSNPQEFEYTYDSAGRLTAVSLNGNPLNSYSYDSNSNRILQTINGVSVGATYDDQDRLLTFGNKSFTYNLNGEVVSMTDSSTSQTINYNYDVLGNLKSVTLPSKTINYKVDAHNRRMAKLDGTTVENYFIWNSSNQIIGVTDGSGALTDRYVYGSKQHVPDYVEKGTDKYQIITNHLGSPVQVINSVSGNIVQEIKYDEFGIIISDTNPGFTVFGFAGCLYDQDTKLCRFGARDYDASIGRWLSKDPILFAGGDTNLYGYVLQDPINYIDTDGLSRNRIMMSPADDVLTKPGGGFGGGGGGSVGPITGYTRHGLNNAISRNGVGVSPHSILNTVRNPISTQLQPNGTTKYTGPNSVVILNSQGQIVTTWPTSSSGQRCGE